MIVNPKKVILRAMVLNFMQFSL